MRKPPDPRELAIAILSRSACSVEVGAVITDAHGVISWGWNSSGPTGMGQCAEQHAISRANRKRLAGATIWVASRRRRNHKIVTARPCARCRPLLTPFNRVAYRHSDGLWYNDDIKAQT